jgi:hypothetical protein
MKKLLLGGILCISAFITKAQTWVYDTVNLNANITQDVFYSMNAGTVKAEDNKNWLFGLSTKAQTAGIFINHGAGVRAFAIHKDTSMWNSVALIDTAAALSLVNPDTSWTVGAMNTNKGAGVFDFGWGKYNLTTHKVYGDSLFIIGAGNNFYKVQVVEMSGTNDYTFKVGVLGQPIPALNFTFNKAPKFSSSNLIYVTTGGMTNPLKDTVREPNNNSWDLLFTNYFAWENNAPFYLSVGALSNSGVKVAQITGTPKDQVAATYNVSMLKGNINEIGYDWKTFSPPSYTIDTLNSYVVSAKDGMEYQIAFNYYGGKANGKIGFAKKPLGSPTAITELNSSLQSFGVYPNPTQNNVILSLDAKSAQAATITINDAIGKTIRTVNASLNQGLNAIELNTSDLSKGSYLITIAAQNIRVSKTILKN